MCRRYNTSTRTQTTCMRSKRRFWERAVRPECDKDRDLTSHCRQTKTAVHAQVRSQTVSNPLCCKHALRPMPAADVQQPEVLPNERLRSASRPFALIKQLYYRGMDTHTGEPRLSWHSQQFSQTVMKRRPRKWRLKTAENTDVGVCALMTSSHEEGRH